MHQQEFISEPRELNSKCARSRRRRLALEQAREILRIHCRCVNFNAGGLGLKIKNGEYPLGMVGTCAQESIELVIVIGGNAPTIAILVQRGKAALNFQQA